MNTTEEESHRSPRLRSRLTGLLLFLSLLSYPLSILWISLGGGGGAGGSSAPPAPPPPPLRLLGRVQAEPGPTHFTSSCSGKEALGSLEGGALPLSSSEAPSGLYPACLRLVKMLSMLSASLRGLHAGRYLPEPAPPE